MEDLTGKKYNRFTVLKLFSNKTGEAILWACVCDCGEIRNVRGSNLRSGNSKSCGCLQKEQRIAFGLKETKVCKHCNQEKSINNYQKAGGGKWLQPYCKSCDKKRKEIHRVNNIEKYAKNGKEYYEKTKKLVDPIQKEINIKKSIEKLVEFNRVNKKPKMPDDERRRRKSESDKQYRIKNPEKILQQKKNYYKEKGLEKSKDWQRKMKSDINFVTKKRLRGRVYVALKRGVKSARTMDLLGCTIEEFKAYFESKFTDGMTWDKYMKGGIHIDHIVPCVLFDLTKEEQQRKCFHYTNMQPLWAIDNLVKGKKVL